VTFLIVTYLLTYNVRQPAAVDRVRRVAVEELVLSQVDKPKGTDQLVRFCTKRLFSVQVCVV